MFSKTLFNRGTFCWLFGWEKNPVFILSNSSGAAFSIKSVGLVAGFDNFKSDICLSEIGFY